MSSLHRPDACIAGPLAESAIAARAAALFQEAHSRQARATDRIFAGLMILQWIGAILAAVIITPRTWIGATSEPHLKLIAAIVGGAIIVALPLALILTRPGEALTRHIVAAAQMLWSALLIHLTGGRIETHFHVFGSLAFLFFYRDWKVLMTATAVIGMDHFLRGTHLPQSVFGVMVASPWRWLEHVGWVLFEVTFLIFACRRGAREMQASARRQAALEESKATTERIVQERTAELDVARRAAEEASRAKSEFLANMSHEIRTPMAAILGYVELLSDESHAGEERQKSLHTIRRNGEHLLEILSDILDISRIEAGRLALESIEVDPIQILDDVLSLMHVRAAEKGLELRVERFFPLPQRIWSDPTRLRQILINLVGNAIKFTSQGEVAVRVRLDAEAGRPTLLRFEIEDTGPGMPASVLQTVFEPFAQADSTTTRKYGGAGLGLAISRRLAIALGGDIRLSSTLGEGTQATVTINPGSLAGAPMLTSMEQRWISQAADDEPAPRRGALTLRGRILLAEDGPDNQRLISTFLRAAGALVEVVENGRLGVERAIAAQQAGRGFDLILLDMQMPELDGYGAAAALRTLGCRTPIIALTAHAMTGDRERCLRAGCDDYASKPIQRELLIALCHRWLTSGRPEGAGRADAA